MKPSEEKRTTAKIEALIESKLNPRRDYDKQELADLKTCYKSVVGVIVIGPERGKSYRVCVDKDCKVHWHAVKREKEKAKIDVEQAKKQQEERSRKEQAKWKQVEEQNVRWRKSMRAIQAACEEKVKTASLGALLNIVTTRNTELWSKRTEPKTIEDLGRAWALRCLISEMSSWRAWETFPKLAKQIGIDVKPLLIEDAKEKKNER